MMQTVTAIINAHGKHPDTLETGDHLKIEVRGFEPLVIEKVGANLLSVAHYYTQMGDLMADPDIVFRIEDDGTWTPIEYTNHGLGVYRHDESGLNDIHGFIKTWDRNLEQQGFLQEVNR